MERLKPIQERILAYSKRWFRWIYRILWVSFVTISVGFNLYSTVSHSNHNLWLEALGFIGWPTLYAVYCALEYRIILLKRKNEEE